MILLVVFVFIGFFFKYVQLWEDDIFMIFCVEDDRDIKDETSDIKSYVNI